jgi:hypothetical protein
LWGKSDVGGNLTLQQVVHADQVAQIGSHELVSHRILAPLQVAA